MPCRILLLGLDGFDIDLAEQFIREGMLPNFARLKGRGASFDLDHGRDKYSGLAWEHISSGIRPSDGARWSAVNFDPKTYRATQDYTTVRPFLADLPSLRPVVFDFPYLDLSRAPNVCGITAWGAHDPGVSAACNPSGLHQELTERFGPYPASEWIYGFCWPSAEKARAAGQALTEAVKLRCRAAQWLLAERLPDWDLGVCVISECHSAIEPMWHGLDPDHPLHCLDSAAPAAAGLRSVYSAIDDMLGELASTFPDARLLLVAMHGMGANHSDVPAMALLPELLYRSAFHSPYMQPVAFPKHLPDGTPLLPEDWHWGTAMQQVVPTAKRTFRQRALRKLRRTLFGNQPNTDDTHTGVDLNWMPAARYSPFWPKMPAFALPSFYDGRIRINLKGREARGKVSPKNYQDACDQVRAILSECRNAQTGKPVVLEAYSPKSDPFDVGRSEADLYIIWDGASLGFTHPRFGQIGPLPYLRTGGHTGRRGFLTLVGEDFPSGHYGEASSFDVVPTTIALLGQKLPDYVSGRSLLSRLNVPSLV